MQMVRYHVDCSTLYSSLLCDLKKASRECDTYGKMGAILEQAETKLCTPHYKQNVGKFVGLGLSLLNIV